MSQSTLFYSELLEKNNFMSKSSKICNCDESGMPLEHKQLKILALKGTKKVRQYSSSNKTVLGSGGSRGGFIGFTLLPEYYYVMLVWRPAAVLH